MAVDDEADSNELNCAPAEPVYLLDGNLGSSTMEYLHLWGKGLDYEMGYWAGRARVRGGAARLRLLDLAQRRGGQYLRGFEVGRLVTKKGVRRALHGVRRWWWP